MQDNSEWFKRGSVKFIVWIAAILMLCLSAFAVYYFLGIKETVWSVDAKIGEGFARVTVVWSYHSGILRLGHQFFIDPWGDRYDTSVKFSDGRSVEFCVDREPRAIWKMSGKYYAACYSAGKTWLIAEVQNSGTIVPIKKSELPGKDLTFNLCVDSQGQEYWRKEFELWAE